MFVKAYVAGILLPVGPGSTTGYEHSQIHPDTRQEQRLSAGNRAYRNSTNRTQ